MKNYIIQYKCFIEDKIKTETATNESEVLQEITGLMIDENIEILSLVMIEDGVEAFQMEVKVENYEVSLEKLYPLEEKEGVNHGLFFAFTTCNEEDEVLFSSKGQDVVDLFANNIHLSDFQFHYAYNLNEDCTSFIPVVIEVEKFKFKLKGAN